VTATDPTADEARRRFADAANQAAGLPAPPVDAADPDRLGRDIAERWAHDGYLVLRGAVEAELVAAVDEQAIDLVRRLDADGEDVGGYRLGERSLTVPEPNLRRPGARPEDRVSKLFNLHRAGASRAVSRHPAVVDVLVGILGPDVDCVNSQFIFKNPGAWGQPWHQDSLYFSFDRSPQVGVWLATSEATPENGCLHVLPGSHVEPLHEHVPDRRPGANLGYLEIVDHDFRGEVAVAMSPGDVLVFHSFLMHRSGDNRTDGRRTALVHHHAATGTRWLGPPSGTVDPVPVAAAGRPLP